MMTLTECARDVAGCSRVSDAGDRLMASYRVAFGAGAGSLRSRDQALSDVYRELRDRTGFGTRVAAVTRRLEATGASAPSPAPTKSSSAEADPLIVAARDLMVAVDQDGEVLLDVARRNASCKVSLMTGGLDAGTPRCLIYEPSHAGGHEGEGQRAPERRPTQ